MTLAVLVANRGFFPSSVIESARAEMKEAIEKAGAKALLSPVELTKYGAVETIADGMAFNEFLNEHRGEFDGLVICLPNFGDENGILEAIKDLNVPILVQAYPDEIGKMDFSSRRDAFCGKLALGSVFKQLGIKFTSNEPFVMHPLSPEFEKEINYFISLCRTVKGMRHLRMGVFGARTTAFKSVRFDEIALAKHGIDTESLDFSQVLEYYNEVEDNDPQIPIWSEKLLKTSSFENVPPYAIVNLSKLGIAFERIVKDYKLDVVAIRCWSELQHSLKVAPCSVMGVLNESGIPAVCETDASNAILMSALYYASGNPTGCLDINNNFGNENDKCILFHCGPLPISLMTKKGNIEEHKMFVKTQGTNCSWGVNVGVVKPGDITIAGGRTEDGEIQFFAANAEITDDEIENEFFGTPGVLRLDNLQKKLKILNENGFRHHAIITAGHHYAVVKEALTKYLGWKEIEL